MKIFIDAFIKNKAPFIIEEVGYYGREAKRYLPEAYTDSYMIRSDKTGHLCRYVVQTDEGTQSLYGYYGVKKSSKDPISSVYKILEIMTPQERKDFVMATFTERFNTEDECLDFMMEYTKCRYRITEPEKFALNNKYLSTIIYSIVKEHNPAL